MPFIVRPSDRIVEDLPDGLRREWLIPPGRLPDGRLEVAIVEIPAGGAFDVVAPDDGLAWFQVLAGSVVLGDDVAGAEHVVMLSHGRSARLGAQVAAEVLIAYVPHAEDSHGRPDLRRIDWTTEPVLLSEHDSRRRIYLASSGLWGTEAVKGEIIIYPPGAVGAAHHHEGAEHFQFILEGEGTAVLGGQRVLLRTGDLLYNLEHEIHSFENLGARDMVFVEFFVPGRNKTVWVPGANVCAWNPLSTDVRGRPAARQLEAHVHGEGKV